MAIAYTIKKGTITEVQISGPYGLDLAWEGKLEINDGDKLDVRFVDTAKGPVPEPYVNNPNWTPEERAERLGCLYGAATIGRCGGSLLCLARPDALGIRRGIRRRSVGQ